MGHVHVDQGRSTSTEMFLRLIIENKGNCVCNKIKIAALTV